MKLGLRSALKRGIAVAAARTGASRWFTAGGQVRLYGYHHVAPAILPRDMPPMVITPATFAAHLDHLTRHHEIWSLDDALDLLDGTRAAPKNGRDVAVITFDDGYQSVLEHAAPLLRARHLPATMYVTTGTVTDGRPLPHDRLYALILRCVAKQVRLLGSAVEDRCAWPLARADFALTQGDTIGALDAILEALDPPDTHALMNALAARVGEPTGAELPPMLDWEGCSRLQELGFTIDAHTVTHAHLTTCDEVTLQRELAEPRAEITARMGRTPTTFAYPAGRYDERAAKAVAAAGYRAALTTEDAPNRPGADLFRLGRKILSDAHGPTRELCAAHLDGLFTTLRLTRALPGDRRLEAPWK